MSATADSDIGGQDASRQDEPGPLPSYGFQSGRRNSVASLGNPDPLTTDYATTFGSDGFRLFTRINDQWLQAPPVFNANPIALSTAEGDYVLYAQRPDTLHHRASFSEWNLLHTAVLPTNTDSTPTPITESMPLDTPMTSPLTDSPWSSYFPEPQSAEHFAPETRTTIYHNPSPATATQPYVDPKNTENTSRLNAEDTAFKGPVATQRPPNTVQLRTARRRKSRRSFVTEPDIRTVSMSDNREALHAMESQSRARLKHKRVEKQYRNRLSNQFERLLAVLPSEEFSSSCRGGGDGGSDNGNGGDDDSDEGPFNTSSTARVTKAEVLDVATRLITECQCGKKGRRNTGDRRGDSG